MRRREGFTLIELMVVIAIILILAAILFPVFAAMKQRARASKCMSNLNQLGKAITAYTGDYDGKFPCTRRPANFQVPTRDIRFFYALGGETWIQRIDTYVHRGSVEDAQKGLMVGVFNCPDWEKKWPSSYVDYHSYGYNFLYLGMPYKPYNTNYPDSAARNPYGSWGFMAGARKLGSVQRPAEMVMLLENRSIWAFPPYKPDGNAYIPENRFISPRHNDRVSVVFVDGHCEQYEPRKLVAENLPLQMKEKDGTWALGTAIDNRLWDLQ